MDGMGCRSWQSHRKWVSTRPRWQDLLDGAGLPKMTVCGDDTMRWEAGSRNDPEGSHRKRGVGLECGTSVVRPVMVRRAVRTGAIRRETGNEHTQGDHPERAGDCDRADRLARRDRDGNPPGGH